MTVDDVTKDAQNDGYLDGRFGRLSRKYEAYSSLQRAYLCGLEFGRADRDKLERAERERETSQ